MFMFLRVKPVLTAKGPIMRINKQAAIKTAKVFLSVLSISILTSLLILNVSVYILSILFSVGMICGMIYMIYKVSLNQIEWDEKSREREHLWKKIDEERYGKKLHESEELGEIRK
jgi:hypothetical protein